MRGHPRTRSQPRPSATTSEKMSRGPVPYDRDAVSTPAVPSPELVTAVLETVDDADRTSVERVLPDLYGELRRVADRLFAGHPAGHTLQPTAVVHEAYLKLAGRVDVRWRDRPHFMALAAKVMRELLADHARRRLAEKRGGGRARLTLAEDLVAGGRGEVDLLALHDVIARLGQLNPRHGAIVEMRCYAGLSVPEIADLLGVSRRTVELDWRAARAWLECELGAGP